MNTTMGLSPIKARHLARRAAAQAKRDWAKAQLKKRLNKQ
jgi:hypothetical protein